MRYDPVTDPDAKSATTIEIHREIDEMTGPQFDGIVVRDGVVKGILGDLTESDIDAIENYLGASLVEADSSNEHT
ncbi:hypothetical protein [Haloferax volcanii]|uniref:hypothetical protein n=1 Tax=Haloferax volcanii TaxID=2246 RepID=UPI00249A30F0|nr:hypothetical protein [Haloferax alexandrinus]